MFRYCRDVASANPACEIEELSVDELAARAGLPTRTIREYQTIGLLPAPERRGRVGIYRVAHLHRLQLIGRMQERGYSLAGIKDLLTSWRDGDELTDILGLTPDELVHLDEPGAPATLDQLARLVPQLVPDRLDELLAVGAIDQNGPERYCVPSPSLLQLTLDALDAGYDAEAVLSLLRSVHDAAKLVADAAGQLLHSPPAGFTASQLDKLASRSRGLLAHGTGRLAIYTLGQQLDRDGPGRGSRRH
jgi:DNA-binding transcriptional MerR regulator